MAVFPNSARIFNPDAAWTAAQARPDFVSWLASTLQLPGAAEAEALTIANGQITPTRGMVIVDTEGAAAADDLTTIAAASVHEGALLYLRAASSARAVTVKHGTGVGGISLLNAADVLLSDTYWLVLRRTTDRWVEVATLRASPAQYIGKYSGYPISRPTNQIIPVGVEENIFSAANTSGDLPATKINNAIGWTVQAAGTYNISMELAAQKESTPICALYVYIKRSTGGTAGYLTSAVVSLADTSSWYHMHTSTPVQLLAGDAVFVTARAEGAEIKILKDSGRAVLTRLR